MSQSCPKKPLQKINLWVDGRVMAALRKLLMYCSALAVGIIFAAWLLFNRSLDIMPFGLMVLFSANAFYMYFSRPTVQTSDILENASSKLTLASLELKYLSQEAQLREIESEKIRLANAEKEKYKLQVAKDMLEHLQLKMSSRRSSATDLRQIIHRPRIGNEVLAQLVVSPQSAMIDKPQPADFPTRRVVNLPCLVQ